MVTVFLVDDHEVAVAALSTCSDRTLNSRSSVKPDLSNLLDREVD